jgi:lysyl-tRNA synthetase class 2
MPLAELQRLRGRRATLEARARILRAVRRWFDSEGFLEVETPARVRSPGQEIHLDAIPAHGGRGGGGGVDGDVRWLVTSPEYHMKRLCAAGYEKIVQIGKAWRGGERGPHHQTEFTIVEWYRAGAPLETIARDCEALLRAGAEAAGIDAAARKIDTALRRATVAELVKAHAGVDLAGDESAEALRGKAIRANAFAGAAPPAGTAWDDVFFQMFLDRVEPELGRGAPMFVFDWPAPLGALARRKPHDPRFVERFELYAGGLELANAFGELTDPVEQRARFEDEARIRAARGKDVYPLDERLLAALPHMPATSGIALGFDRLVMFLLGLADIRDVVAFAADEV